MKVLFDRKNERINLFDESNDVNVMYYSLLNKCVSSTGCYDIDIDDLDKFIETIDTYKKFVIKKEVIEEQIGDLFDLWKSI